MRTYQVKVGEREFTVAVSNGTVIEIDGVPVEGFAVHQSGDHRFTVISSEGTYPVAAVRSGGGYDVVSRGVNFRITTNGERERLRERLPHPAPGAGMTQVRSPMPALVARVEVGPGETVQPGQILVVLEEMKMENDVRSPAGGTVQDVAVAAGATVEKDQLLLTII